MMYCKTCAEVITSRAEGNHHEKSPDHRESLEARMSNNISTLRLFSHLEEIILEEVSHGLVSRNVPPGVEIEVEDVEPGDENQGGELGLVADGDEHHEEGADQVLDDLHGGHLEAEEGEEHEDKKDPARQLQIHFRLVLPQAGYLANEDIKKYKYKESAHPSKERFPLNSGLGENEEESSDEGEVAEEKLEIPQDAVGDSLHMLHYRASEAAVCF